MTDHGSQSTEPAWRKSRRSNPNGACVELAPTPGGGIAVRDSKHPDGAVLHNSATEIAALVHAVNAGGFDDLIS